MNSLKKNIIFIILFISTNSLLSQNLIYNGSFEIRKYISSNLAYYPINCPFMEGSQQPNDIYESHFEIAKGWYDAHYRGDEIYCTFDFYHSCCDTTYPGPISPNYCSVGIPYNYSFSGYQYPRTGNGFIGGAIYVNNYSEPKNTGEFALCQIWTCN